MGALSLSIAIASIVLELSLILRAWQAGMLRQFSMFFSYVGYLFCSSLVCLIVLYRAPSSYPSVAWFCLLVTFMAEFLVLLEISEHIFGPFPAIRRLGRLVTVSVSLVYFLAFMLPLLIEHRSRSLALLELTRTAALTKGAIIVALLAAVRLYQLPLGRHIPGILLGFAAYLAVAGVNVVAVESFGWAIYRQAFAVIGPMSFVLGLSIWNIALWQYEPAVRPGSGAGHPGNGHTGGGNEELTKYQAELMRLLRR